MIESGCYYDLQQLKGSPFCLNSNYCKYRTALKELECPFGYHQQAYVWNRVEEVDERWLYPMVGKTFQDLNLLRHITKYASNFLANVRF